MTDSRRVRPVDTKHGQLSMSV